MHGKYKSEWLLRTLQILDFLYWRFLKWLFLYLSLLLKSVFFNSYFVLQTIDKLNVTGVTLYFLCVARTTIFCFACGTEILPYMFFYFYRKILALNFLFKTKKMVYLASLFFYYILTRSTFSMPAQSFSKGTLTQYPKSAVVSLITFCLF